MGARITGTLATAALLLLLAGCASTAPVAPQLTGSPTASRSALESDMVAAHPSCAGHTSVQADGGVGCVAEGHLWVVYAFPSRADADDAAATLKVIHPTGTLEVETTGWGALVWVTE